MANTYYVDNSQPNDDGDGLSEENAWKTINKLQTELNGDQSDDIVKFKCGEEWRAQYTVAGYGTSGQPFVHDAYGSGNDPIINGADLIETWSDASPPANSWSATCTTEPNQVFFDGVRGIKESSEANLNAATEWFWDSSVLYIYYEEDPDGAVVIEASVQDRCIYVYEQDYITLKNLEVKYSNDSNIYFHAYENSCDNFVIDNINSHEADHTGIVIWGTHVFVTNGLIKNCDLHDNNHMGIFMGEDTTGPTGVIIEYNTIYNNGKDQLSHGIYVSHADNNTIRYNSISGSSGNGIQFQYGSDSNEFYYNIVYGNGMDGIYMGQGDGGNNNLIYNNVIYDNTNFGIHLDAGATVTGNVIKNNIIYQVNVGGFAPCIRFQDDASAQAQTLDYNCYYYPNAATPGDVIEVNGNNLNLTEWQAYAGSPDPNSISSNPLIINPANGDFHLQSGSPCIDKGVDVSLTEDYDGKAIPRGVYPDIGALEWQGDVIREGIKIEIEAPG